MKSERIDLKSLKILNAVIETQSVNAAAEMLAISPSSVTYSLNKLRTVTANPIISRAGSGIVPTTLALDLNARYLKVISLINEGLGVASLDDRSGTDFSKNITLATYSLMEFWLSVAMMQRSNELEGMVLDFSPLELSDEDRLTKLRKREVDIDIGTQLPKDSSIISYQLFSSGMVVAAGRHNSVLQGELTIEKWKQCQHVGWKRANNGDLFVLGDAITLKEAMSERTLAVMTASSLNMVMLCANSEALMLLPGFIAPFVRRTLPVTTYDLPFDLSLRCRYYLHTHKKSLTEEGISRMVTLISQLAEGVI